MSRFLSCIVTLVSAAAGLADEVTVITPRAGEKAYEIAGEQFVDLWEKATGRRPLAQQAEIDQNTDLRTGWPIESVDCPRKRCKGQIIASKRRCSWADHKSLHAIRD
jgi:hypothetical protein